jgi:hypothetical protein
MIQLRSDCLVFKMNSGEAVPCSAELVTVELIGPAVDLLDPEVVKNAASSVLHYFRHELGRTEVTVTEFSSALERVLRGLGYNVVSGQAPPSPRVAETDLRQLASGSAKGYELVFFSRLREAMGEVLEQSPEVVRFTGLRGCVKQLVGARRWGRRCQQLNDQIVDYARRCWGKQRSAQASLLMLD